MDRQPHKAPDLRLQRPIRPRTSMLLLVLRVGDMLLVPLSLAMVMLVMDRAPLFSPPYLLAALIAMLLFAFFAMLCELYPAGRDQRFDFAWGRMAQVWTMTVLCLLLLGFATKTTAVYSRLVISGWIVLMPPAMVLWRRLLFRLIRTLERQEAAVHQVAIAGAGALGVHLGRLLLRDTVGSGRLVAFYDDFKPTGRLESVAAGRPTGPIAEIPVAGTLDDLCTAVTAGEIDRIYMALPLRAEARMREVIKRLGDACATVYVVPDLFVFDLVQPHWFTIAGLPVVSIYDTPHSGINSWLKKFTDYSLALLILAVCALPMLLIAAGIKLTSPGPVIFRQRRYGLDGREIVVWKFRSMKICEDNPRQCVQAHPGDPRLTPFGAFLRRHSLDELPQFFNVLQGRLSVVGPRPHAVAHNELYRRLIPGYMLRHKVRPGITGWAQINGLRGETDTLEKMEQRVAFDMHYILNWSVWLDLKIVALTALREFRGKNAY